MLNIDAAEARRHLAFERLIPQLATYFAEGCEVPLRHRHEIAVPGGATGSILIMPAWRPGGLMGVKTIGIFPGNAARGLPGLHAAYQLFDAATGVPLAVIDGIEITSRRTAAASALAARHLARPDARRLLVVGAGRIARLLPEAYRAVRDIEHVEVWTRRPEAGDALVAEFAAAGFAARRAGDLSAAVACADIVSCATLSTAPLILGAWLPPGCHLDLIGGFTPQMRETDAECFRRTRVFIDTGEALIKAGDLLEAIAAGAFAPEQVAADLETLCRGAHPGRTDAAEITVFKSVGSALEDLAAAALVHAGVAAAR